MLTGKRSPPAKEGHTLTLTGYISEVCDFITVWVYTCTCMQSVDTGEGGSTERESAMMVEHATVERSAAQVEHAMVAHAIALRMGESDDSKTEQM